MLESPKMAEMDLKTTTSAMEALVRISVSILVMHWCVYFWRLRCRMSCARPSTIIIFFKPILQLVIWGGDLSSKDAFNYLSNVKYYVG